MALNEIRVFLEEFKAIIPNENSFQVKNVAIPIVEWEVYFRSLLLMTHNEHDIASLLECYVQDLLKPRILKVLDLLARVEDTFMFSVNELRTIYSAMDLFWLLGISPTLQVYSSFSVDSTAQFPKAMLFDAQLIQELLVARKKVVFSVREIVDMMNLFQQVLFHNSFDGFVLNRNMDRFLFYLLTLSSLSDQTLHGIVSRQTIEEQIQLTIAPKFQSLTISKLRNFTKAPEPIKLKALEILTKILLSGKDGARSVIVGYLDGVIGTNFLEPMQAQLARLVSSIPKEHTSFPLGYLRLICPSLLQLLEESVLSKDSVLAETITLILLRIIQFHPQFAEELILKQLFAPLLTFLSLKKKPGRASTNTTDEATQGNDDTVPATPKKSLITEVVTTSQEMNFSNKATEKISASQITHQQFVNILVYGRLLLLRFPVFRNLIVCFHNAEITLALSFLFRDASFHAWAESQKKNNTLTLDDNTNRLWSASECLGTMTQFDSLDLLHSILSKLFINSTATVSSVNQVAVRTLFAFLNPSIDQIREKITIDIDFKEKSFAFSSPLNQPNQKSTALSFTQLSPVRDQFVPKSAQFTAVRDELLSKLLPVTPLNNNLVLDVNEATAGDQDINRELWQLLDEYLIRFEVLLVTCQRLLLECEEAGNTTSRLHVGLFVSSLFCTSLSQFLLSPPAPSSSSLTLPSTAPPIFPPKLQRGIAMFLLQKSFDADVLFTDRNNLLRTLKTIFQACLDKLVRADEEEDLLENKKKLIEELDSDDEVDEAQTKDNGNDDDEDSDLMEIASQIFSLLLGQYTTSKISLDAEEKNTLQSIQQLLQEIFMRSNSIAAKTEMNDELVSLISRIISLLVMVDHPLDSLEKSSKSTNKDDNLLDQINAIEKEYLFEFSPVLRAYGIAEIKKLIQTKSFDDWKSYEARLFEIIFPLLLDQDSFVYLQTVTCLCEWNQKTETFLLWNTLLELYSLPEDTWLKALRDTEGLKVVEGVITNSLGFFDSFASLSGTPIRLFSDRLVLAHLAKRKDSQFTSTSTPHNSQYLNNFQRLKCVIGEVIHQILAKHKYHQTAVNRSYNRSYKYGIFHLILITLKLSSHRTKILSKEKDEAFLDKVQNSVHVFSGRMTNYTQGGQPTILDEEELAAIDQLYGRQSAQSILSELIVQFFAFDHHFFLQNSRILDVLDVCKGILLFENSRDYHPVFFAMRRSAVFLLRHLLENCHETLFLAMNKSDGFPILTEILRVMKRIEGDPRAETAIRQQSRIVMDELKELTLHYSQINYEDGNDDLARKLALFSL